MKNPLLVALTAVAAMVMLAMSASGAIPTPQHPPQCGVMTAGQGLLPGETLTSCDARFTLSMQTDSNLVLYMGGTALWASNTVGKNAAEVILQSDGNLVIYDTSGAIIWSSGTSGNSGSVIHLQNDGNLVLYSSSNSALWATGTFGHVIPGPTQCGYLTAGQGLSPGRSLTSCDSRFLLTMQTNGNLVLSMGGTVLWSSNTTAGYEVVMQSDGNFVVYSLTTALWASGTAGNSGAFLDIQTDGNTVIYNTANVPIWTSVSCCHPVQTTFKPPSVPLVVREPYMNTWLRNATDTAPGTWPAYWNGTTKAITGIAYIDGKAYTFFGAPGGVPGVMTQMALQITPTQSIFTFNGGGVTLTVGFFTPVEATDIRRLSMPLSDIITTAQSSDGGTHTVSIYFDISGEWAHGDSNQLIRWASETINRNADGSSTGGTLSAWTITPNSPTVLNQVNDYPSWGTALWATATSSNLTTQSGADVTVRGQFVSAGKLLNTNDANQPRAINNSWPVFAFSRSFGAVGNFTSQPFVLLIGHVRDPALSYLGSNVSSLWRQYWAAPENMLAFAYNDVPAAMSRASSLDTKITNAASAIGGPHYAALSAITLRQAFAGTELVGTTSNPWMFLEEISSDDNVSTVDVLYPSMPAFLYTNPELVKYLLAPVIAYTESGHWPLQFAPHDLGAVYPNATGHNDGGGENMPVEETANMLIMADAYMRQTTPANASAYATAHYAIFKQWANYLLTVPAGVPFPNALDPQFQNQTDDFTGQIAHSVNLALKGIIGVGAMGQIAAFAGNTSDASFYSGQAQSLISKWVTLSQNSNSSHLLLQYREAANAYSADTTSEPDTAWSLKYNSWPDKFLGLNLVPESVTTEEANFYKTMQTAKGVPLDYRHTYTKADWELWTAGGTDDLTLRQNIIDEIYNWANTTTSATPFPDLYDPSSTSTSFSARPVMGGAYAPLLPRHTTAVP